MKDIRLLLVDDQELIRESLHIVLDMEADLEVVGMAENGRVAIELCESLQPNVVLMDIHMPEMDGVEASRLIKERWPDVKVIILTTFQDINYVVEALGAGAEGYLLKAIHPKDLAAGIRLVHRGGTLIPQDLAKLMVAQLIGQTASSDASSATGTAAVSGGVTMEPKHGQYGLSERELQVLQCLSDGLSNKEIAKQLFLSEGTVKNYISSIYSKLDVRDRIHAAKKAQEEGMI